MKVFFCDCGNLVHFENVACVACGRSLAFLPDKRDMVVVEPADERLCRNGKDYGACNWLVRAADDNPFCIACRLNQIVPPLVDDAARAAWIEIERAKRRLVYSLLEIGLPLVSKADDPERGLAFAFLQQENPQEPVVTGHAGGVITLNIAEADDPFREEVRRNLGETYRTLLGHLRHEVGHYYWHLFFAGDEAAGHRFRDGFRDMFGDENQDYDEALKQHYNAGAPANWRDRFVSAYASSHPWEDWAETFAHYLHMRDTTETAQALGVGVLSVGARDPVGRRIRDASTRVTDSRSFEGLMRAFPPLTLAINALNRSMGVRDAYPFVLSAPAIAKMRFVHDTALEAARKHSTNHEGGRT